LERRLLAAHGVDPHTTDIERNLVMSSQDQDKRNQESRQSSDRPHPTGEQQPQARTDRGPNQTPSQPIDRSPGKSAEIPERGEAQKSLEKTDGRDQTESAPGSFTPRKGIGSPDRSKIHYGDTEPDDPRESGIEADGGTSANRSSSPHTN
jgi:hypothetical protein